MIKVISLLIGFLNLVSAVQYNNFQQLGPKYNLSWTTDNENAYLKLEVETLGWVGFGIGEQSSGSMPGSDIVTGYVKQDGTVEIQDRYATAFEYPNEDQCQDWQLVSGTEANGKTTLEVTRKLVTNDPQDRPFTTGYMKIVFAYGSSDVVSYHGNNRYIANIPLIPNNTVPFDASQFKSIEFSGLYTIPAESTTYACGAYVLPEMENDAHIVALEVIMDNNTIGLVHHSLVYVCETDKSTWFANRLNNPELCDDPTQNEGERYCYGVLWGWAPGVARLVLPEVTGFRFGPGNDSMKYIMVQIHYDNPQLLSGKVDNTALKMYYTETLRPNDAGVVVLGDPSTDGTPIPPGQSSVEYEYECTSACTSQWEHEINVLYSELHMHKAGSMAWSTHWRNGEELGNLNRVEYYDFNFQSFNPVNKVVKPGDRINTHCVYNTQDRSAPTQFGEPSDWEMCMEFIVYYPKLNNKMYFCGFIKRQNSNFTVCGLNLVNERNPTNNDPVGGLEKSFGAKPTAQCNTGTTGVTTNNGVTTNSNNEEEDSSAQLSFTTTPLLLLVALILYFV